MVTYEIVPALLASPAFRDEHAHRLIDLLVRHEAASVNGYQQAMRHEYLALHNALLGVAKEPRNTARPCSACFRESKRSPMAS